MTRILDIGGNAGLAAGRDINIGTLTIGICPLAADAGGAEQQLEGLMADFAQCRNGGAPATELNGSQLLAMAEYRLKLENLMTAARQTRRRGNKTE